MPKYDRIISDVSRYYGEKLAEHGVTPRGVDWNGVEGQHLRFRSVLAVCDLESRFSINEIGCGYGAMYDYLDERASRFKYTGSDVNAEMVRAARAAHRKSANCRFVLGNAALRKADYTVTSGLFNVKLGHSAKAWKAYTLAVLGEMNRLSTRGFSFNMLTKYSDRDRMVRRLYYADPCFYFDYCKREFSRNVAVLHDYGLYEFTILVRKDL